MFYPVTDVLHRNADFGSLAEELVRAALLAETAAAQTDLRELSWSWTGGTLLGYALQPPPAQAETLSTVRVLEDLSLVHSGGS